MDHQREDGRKECCLDIYMQFLPPGMASGKHRHLSEEVFYVVEGSGYDLHWDVKFDCKDKMEFEWADEPQKFEWKMGDFVYIPPCARTSTSTPIRRTKRASSWSTAGS